MNVRIVEHYTIGQGEHARVTLPVGGELLSVGRNVSDQVILRVLQGRLHDWASLSIGWFASGTAIPDGWEYVGSTELNQGSDDDALFSVHVFKAPAAF
jgi:hypothetical protein